MLILTVEPIETTRAGDAYRTYRPGRKRAYLGWLRIPVALAGWLHRRGVR